MSVRLDVSKQIEARFAALAEQSGKDPEALFEAMVMQYQSSVKNSQFSRETKFTADNDPLMARLEARIAAAPTSPEEIRDAEEDMRDLMRRLNANRKETGERIPFPEVQ